MKNVSTTCYYRYQRCSEIPCKLLGESCFKWHSNYLFVSIKYQAWIQEKNEPPQNFPVSRFYPMFPRFFTNKIFQGSQVRTLRQSESAPIPRCGAMSRISGLRNDMNKRTFYKKRKINNRCFDFLSKQNIIVPLILDINENL